MKPLFRKLTTMLAAAALLAGCAGTAESPAGKEGPATQTEANPRAVVAWFSATGNTERVAKEIASLTGAAQFEITPAEPYTDEDLNFNEESSRVVQEYQNRQSRDIPLAQTKVDHWDDIDVVYLGYPIWWGGAAWPVDNFVKENNFDGKKVYPFCTSLSSPAGSSAEDLEQLTGTGDWQPAMRFSEDAGTDEIRDWLQSAGQLPG